MEKDKPYFIENSNSQLISNGEVNSAVLSLPAQINNTRIAQLPNTLSALAEIGITTRETLPILSQHQKDEDFIKLSIATAYKDNRIRPILMSEVDSVTDKEAVEIYKNTEVKSKTAEEEEPKVWDIFTVGTGWGGVIATARIRTILPNADILMVDDRSRRGGQFRDKGFDYSCNSPTEGENSGLPGEMDGPNNLGPDVLLQIGELTEEPFPFKQVVGDAIAINGFYEAPAIPDAEVTNLSITGDPTMPYKINVWDKNSNNENVFYSRMVILATGQGKSKWGFDINQPDTKEALDKYAPNIFVADDFREHLILQTNQELLQMVQRGLAFGGGRDGTNIALRYIISRLRENLTDQKIKELSVNVYGAYYSSSDDFSEVTGTHVYDDLIPFIGTFIKPQREKITGLFPASESIGLKLANGEVSNVATFCASAGYTDTHVQNLLSKVGEDKNSVELEVITGTDNLEGQIVAQKIKDQDIFVVGVAAREKKPPRKGKSLRTFGRAIRKHAPRILNASDYITEKLKTSSTNENVLYERGSKL